MIHGNDHPVEILLGEHLAVVGVGFFHLVLGRSFCQHLGPEVRDGDDFGVGMRLQGGKVGGGSPPVGADDGDSGFVGHGCSPL
jgi:hypothetical protein